MLGDEFDAEPTSGDLLLQIMSRKRRMRNKKGDDVDVVDPAVRSQLDPVTRVLAKKQTQAARDMLAKPSAEVKKQMQGAAAKLSDTFGKLDPGLQDALGARLFGEQGLMAKTGAGQANQRELQRAELGAILKRIGGGDRAEPSASDRSILMALMGDIGALFTDTGATTGTVREEGAGDRLREALAKLIGGGQPLKSLQSNFARVKEVGGSEAMAPKKNAERVNPNVQQEAPPERSGIHNVGAEVDDESRTDPTNRLGSSKWAVAHIATGRVAGTAEPFAGHMSGSPSEILQVWDMLLGIAPDDQFTSEEGRRRDEERVNRRLARTVALNKDLATIDEGAADRSAKAREHFAKRAQECEAEALEHEETAKQWDAKDETRAAFYRGLAKDYRQMMEDNLARVEKYREQEALSAKEAQAEREAAAKAHAALAERRKSFEADPRRNERLARAAAAAAFLVGQGYHSAMEVAEGVLRYDGQNLRAVLQADPATFANQDAGDLLYAGAATSLMKELMKSQTNAG